MNYLMVLLRLIHVVGGAFWAGAALVLFFFVTPAIGANGEAGQKFMGYLMGKTRLTMVLASAAGLTILAGAILFWIDSGGFTSAWLGSGPGIGFSLGALSGLIAFIAGIMAARGNTELAALGQEIQGKPTAAQSTRLVAIQSRLRITGSINAWFLLLAAALMGMARYFSF